MKTFVLYAGNIQPAMLYLPAVLSALYAEVLPGSGVEAFLNECFLFIVALNVCD